MAQYSKRFAKLLNNAKKRPEYWASRITLEFANSLDNFLVQKNISRKQLAEKVHVTPAYVTKVLRGDANYTVETMVKLAMAVDARVDVKLLPKETIEWHWLKDTGLKKVEFIPMMVNYSAASNDCEYRYLERVQ